MFGTQNFLCLHCKREFLNGSRGGMFDHANTIETEKIRAIIESCDIMKVELVTILHEFTLRNLLVDLSVKSVAIEIIKKWSIET